MGLGVAHPTHRHAVTWKSNSSTSRVATPFRLCNGNTASESIQPTVSDPELSIRDKDSPPYHLNTQLQLDDSW